MRFQRDNRYFTDPHMTKIMEIYCYEGHCHSIMNCSSIIDTNPPILVFTCPECGKQKEFFQDDLIGAVESEECFKRVLHFFKNNYKKTIIWFATKNPMLGDVAPSDMVVMQRHDKLLQFIKTFNN